MTQKKIIGFQKYIFDWWIINKRDLPWRRTGDPYRIFISELMLQQTQVSRVLSKYAEFIERFPTIQDLSHASLADVLIVWKGMGYNRRAQYIHNTAKTLVSEFGGKFPETEKELLSLPGVGLYTARAIQVFSGRKNVAMVDTNIRQIITHFFFDDTPQAPKIIQKAADELLPVGKSWEWHQALMDYGSLALPRTLPRRQAGMNHKPKTKSIPFKDTPRFIRGRIIDELRTAEYSNSKFIHSIQKKYDKPYEFVSTQLEKLIQEGLVTLSSDGIIRLAS